MAHATSPCCELPETKNSMRVLAPIGLMGDHTHKGNGMMLSYRYMTMSMEGITDGASTINENDYFSRTSYMMAPKSMDRKVHMFGGMYGLTEKVSLALMIPQIENNMTMVKKMGREEVKSSSKGLGDIVINSLYKLESEENVQMVLATGLSVPTGSINEEDNGSKLGYNMQLGSGSYGLNLMLTYTKSFDFWSLGSQIGLINYLNQNTNDYKRGNQYHLSFWATRRVNDKLYSSLRIQQKNIDPIQSDEDSISNMSPSFNPKANHGFRRFAFLGAAYHIKGNKLEFEYGMPIGYQLADYQLAPQNMLTLAWRRGFH